MVLKNKGNSFNSQIKPKKKYDRGVYWCEKDDVWVNVEAPVNK